MDLQGICNFANPAEPSSYLSNETCGLSLTLSGHLAPSGDKVSHCHWRFRRTDRARRPIGRAVERRGSQDFMTRET